MTYNHSDQQTIHRRFFSFQHLHAEDHPALAEAVYAVRLLREDVHNFDRALGRAEQAAVLHDAAWPTIGRASFECLQQRKRHARHHLAAAPRAQQQPHPLHDYRRTRALRRGLSETEELLRSS